MDILYENLNWYDVALCLETYHGISVVAESDTALIGNFTLGDTFNAFVANDVRSLKKTISKSAHHLNVVMNCFSLIQRKVIIPKSIANLVIHEFCKNDNLKLNQERIHFILENQVTKNTKQRIFSSSVFKNNKTVQRQCIGKCPHIMEGMTLDEVRSVFTLTGSEFLRVFSRNARKKNCRTKRLYVMGTQRHNGR